MRALRHFHIFAHQGQCGVCTRKAQWGRCARCAASQCVPARLQTATHVVNQQNAIPNKNTRALSVKGSRMAACKPGSRYNTVGKSEGYGSSAARVQRACVCVECARCVVVGKRVAVAGRWRYPGGGAKRRQYSAIRLATHHRLCCAQRARVVSRSRTSETSAVTANSNTSRTHPTGKMSGDQRGRTQPRFDALRGR